MNKSPLIALLLLLVVLLGVAWLISMAAPGREDDMQDTGMSQGSTLLVTTNPDGAAQDSVFSLDTGTLALSPRITGLDAQGSVESAYTHDGDLFVTVDGTQAGTGGVLVFDDADADEARTFANAERMIMGANTAINGPRGIEVADGLDMIIVSDFGAKNIKLFPEGASGDVAPAYTVALGNGTRSVWDTHYHAASDTLYAAGTDGVVLVYADFSDTFGAAGPTRTITPTANGAKVSVNLHGIHYDAGRDMLVLTDVGSPTDPTDGQIFIMADVSVVTGNAEALTSNARIAGHIAGAQTRLGNPVDLLLDGSTLYVAEKSNDLVLVYENIFSVTGLMNDIPATRSGAVTKPESLTAAGR